MILVEEIKSNVKGEVQDNPRVLRHYSRDASIFEVQPSLVVHPRDSGDLRSLVHFVSGHKKDQPNLSLTARAAGTDMTGGPLTESIVLDFTTHFNHIIELSTTRTPFTSFVQDGYAVVEPGVYYRDFEKATLAKNLILPSYPASKSMCALGGMAANNSGGEKSLLYGKTENYVKRLKAVLADGNEYVLEPLNAAQLERKKAQDNFEGHVYREIHWLIESNYDQIVSAKPQVHKNSAGYALWNVWDRRTFDLTKLFIGSQGTLGLITEITFKLVRPASHSRLLVMFLNDLTELGHLVERVNKFKPESFESYDRHTFSLAIKGLPSLVKKMKGNLLSLGFKFLPELWLTLTGGIPNLILIAEFTGEDRQEVETRMRDCEKAIKEEFNLKTHITKNQNEAEKYWTIRRESYNLLRQLSKNKKPAPFIDDVIVPTNVLPEFLPKLNAILNTYPQLTYTIAGHAGDGNFHIIPLVDLKDPSVSRIIPEVMGKVYDLTLQYHGSMTAEHNDGLIRTPYLEKMYGKEMVALFERTKNIFDPLNIFNPGKKVRGNLEYAMKHIVNF